MGTFIFFLCLVVLLYLTSTYITREMFHTLYGFFKKEKFIFSIISLIYFPGTLLHEMSHFITALALQMHVQEISILPTFEKNYIKLGMVVYDKKDSIRGTLIGISPFFAGLFFFYLVSRFHLFPSVHIGFTLLLGYVIFAVSSTMFSSKQDLVDLVHITPFLFIGALVVYIFNINLSFFIPNQYIIQGIVGFISEVNVYLGISIGINIVFIIFLKVLQKLR